MKFLLTNYKYLVKNDHDYENLDKVRDRDRKIGKTIIRLLERRPFMKNLQMVNHQINLNGTRLPIRIFSHLHKNLYFGRKF